MRSVWYCSNATGYVRSANETGKSGRELKFYHGGGGGGGLNANWQEKRALSLKCQFYKWEGVTDV